MNAAKGISAQNNKRAARYHALQPKQHGPYAQQVSICLPSGGGGGVVRRELCREGVCCRSAPRVQLFQLLRQGCRATHLAQEALNTAQSTHLKEPDTTLHVAGHDSESGAIATFRSVNDSLRQSRVHRRVRIALITDGAGGSGSSAEVSNVRSGSCTKTAGVLTGGRSRSWGRTRPSPSHSVRWPREQGGECPPVCGQQLQRRQPAHAGAQEARCHW